MVKLFANNPDVSFADVDLSPRGLRRNPIFQDYELGKGGWPTIRYFNGETGMEGFPYVSQTSMDRCEELGIKEYYLLDFVQEAGHTSLCYADGTNCDEHSKRYLAKVREVDSNEWPGLLQELQMNGSSDTWTWRRTMMVQQLIEELDSASEL